MENKVGKSRTPTLLFSAEWYRIRLSRLTAIIWCCMTDSKQHSPNNLIHNNIQACTNSLTLAFKVHQFGLQLQIINNPNTKMLFHSSYLLWKQGKMIAFGNKQPFVIKQSWHSRHISSTKLVYFMNNCYFCINNYRKM